MLRRFLSQEHEPTIFERISGIPLDRTLPIALLVAGRTKPAIREAEVELETKQKALDYQLAIKGEELEVGLALMKKRIKEDAELMAEQKFSDLQEGFKKDMERIQQDIIDMSGLDPEAQKIKLDKANKEYEEVKKKYEEIERQVDTESEKKLLDEIIPAIHQDNIYHKFVEEGNFLEGDFYGLTIPQKSVRYPYLVMSKKGGKKVYNITDRAHLTDDASIFYSGKGKKIALSELENKDAHDKKEMFSSIDYHVYPVGKDTMHIDALKIILTRNPFFSESKIRYYKSKFEDFYGNYIDKKAKDLVKMIEGGKLVKYLDIDTIEEIEKLIKQKYDINI